MELEFFCKPGTDLEWFEYWKQYSIDFLKNLGMNMENIRVRDHEKEELSHYSNATSDLEYLFPFGWGELWGIADRTDFDLTRHQEYSGQDMSYLDPETNERYVPYCIEPSLGADRVALAFLIDAYDEETVVDGKGKEDTRVVLRLHPALAPYTVAVLPLSKKLEDVALPIYEELSKHFNVEYDAAGSIGKRYRREDEIGTPFSICVDFDTETDKSVTIRDRDTMEQIRLPLSDVREYIENKLQFYLRRNAMEKFVYSFNEGSKDMRSLLGGKGANLAEMTKIGLPVPFGFTISTDACKDYLDKGGGFIRRYC